jgi:hypothetical protein
LVSSILVTVRVGSAQGLVNKEGRLQADIKMAQAARAALRVIIVCPCLAIFGYP